VAARRPKSAVPTWVPLMGTNHQGSVASLAQAHSRWRVCLRAGRGGEARRARLRLGDRARAPGTGIGHDGDWLPAFRRAAASDVAGVVHHAAALDAAINNGLSSTPASQSVVLNSSGRRLCVSENPAAAIPPVSAATRRSDTIWCATARCEARPSIHRCFSSL
jgi:hypothetical protein